MTSPTTSISPKPKVLVARAWFAEALARLETYFEVESNPEDIILTPAQLCAKLANKQGVITTGSELINADVIAHAPHLKAVCNSAVGYNNLDIAALTQAGIVATNTPDVLTETTADFGWALLLATARRVVESEHWLRAGQWQQWRHDLFLGAEIHGSTLGILGMGRIGQAIARRAQGFGMQVLYHNRQPLSTSLEHTLQARYVDKTSLLQQADHLMLVLPYTPATHHIIGANELACMKPSATLINLARGGIVDDAALAIALHEKRLAAAGLDVFEGEPQVHPGLLEVPNIVLTPHIASATRTTRLKMIHLAIDNLIAALGYGPEAGRPPNILNPLVLSDRHHATGSLC